ncbi:MULTISPECIES: hypothetical protein [Bacteroidaceae]|uniref:Uncharacterized protein n=1 Tax=Phocaeicola barnesiae TaxID=376804 RepID=A0AAW5NBF3_9BACT|nr:MULTISPECIES: hypothetical protein [Bacteroidaceae]MBM6671188.1 hypothetical protein [Phocaeicola coprophilus]MBM6719023.1 hypothetical protein [Bacteroides gallinaceum]MBM6782494.1 hypothetical protein [Bacteroides mediterraneensis]MCR8875204.1 hypothetical protein [Phocaeicola barnesiae]
MDIEQMIKEKRQILSALDKAIDKTFSDDEHIRKEGREELECLRGKDPAVPFFIGYAYEIEYNHTKKAFYAQKAIDEYNNIISYKYAFLDADIKRLKRELNNKS